MFRKYTILSGALVGLTSVPLLMSQEAALPEKVPQYKNAKQPNAIENPPLRQRAPVERPPRLVDGPTAEDGQELGPSAIADEPTTPPRFARTISVPDHVMASWVALSTHQQIGLAEFASQKASAAEVREFADQLIRNRNEMLDRLEAFVPEATRSTYINKTARDARDVSVSTTASALENRARDPSDRLSATRRRTTRRGTVVTEQTGVQTLDGPIVTGNAGAGGIAVGVPLNGINGTLNGVPTGVVNQSGVATVNSANGAGVVNNSTGTIQGGAVPTVAGNNPTGLLSGVAAGNGANAAGVAASNNPSGLLSGTAAGATPANANGVATANSPSGLLGGAAAGQTNANANGVAAGNNPAGLLSGTAAGTAPANLNANAKNAGNSPAGLLGGTAAGATPANANGVNAANNPGGLLSGTAAGATPSNAQSKTSANNNPAGLLGGAAAGATNANANGVNAGNNPGGLLSGAAAGATPSNAQAKTSANNNPAGLLGGAAAGATNANANGVNAGNNPGGLLSGTAAGATPSNGKSQNANTPGTAAAAAKATTANSNTNNSKTTATTSTDVTLNGATADLAGIVGNPNGLTVVGVPAAGTSGTVVAGGGAAQVNGTTVVQNRRTTESSGTVGGKAVTTSEERINAAREIDSANRDFNVLELDRHLAVQSLAGSKKLLADLKGNAFDKLFLAEQIALQQALRDRLTVFEDRVSPELARRFAVARQEVDDSLAEAKKLLGKISSR